MGKRDRDMHDDRGAPEAQPEATPTLPSNAPAAEASPAAAEAPTENEATKLYPVSQLAERHGQVHKGMIVADDEPFKTQHLVASTRHGWRKHHHATGEEVMLTDADYLAALEEAHKGGCHAPANRRDPEDEARRQASRENEAKKQKPRTAKKGA